MFKYRDHRGMLDDSMETVKEFETREQLISYLQDDLPKYDCQKITIENYGGFDERIGWDTHIVHLEGYGVLGFTDKGVTDGDV